MKKTIGMLALALLAGCAGSGSGPAAVERMYVINCGENHVKDFARFTGQQSDAGKQVVFSNHCYLIKHAKGWMQWDTGNPDRFAALPNGQESPIAIAYMKKPLADSLTQVDAKLQDLEVARLGAYAGLVEQVRHLSTSHQQLQGETSRLVAALRSPAARGRCQSAAAMSFMSPLSRGFTVGA